MLRFFKTTLVTNLLQLPLFEAVLAMAHRLPLSAAMQGTCTGFLFATVTLPILNMRYRHSMQLELHVGNVFEAYVPTVCRDMVFGAVRSLATARLVSLGGSTDALVLLLAVVAARLACTPFNAARRTDILKH